MAVLLEDKLGTVAIAEGEVREETLEDPVQVRGHLKNDIIPSNQTRHLPEHTQALVEDEEQSDGYLPHCQQVPRVDGFLQKGFDGVALPS